MVAREVTKRHQEFIRLSAPSEIGQTPVAKGEFTVVVGPKPARNSTSSMASDDLIYSEFCRMTAETTGRRASIAAVALKYGRSAKDVYAIIERLKKSGV